jgi:hypothetical protein
MELGIMFGMFYVNAVSVLSSYEDGVVILALLKETDEFAFLLLSEAIHTVTQLSVGKIAR